MLHACNMARNIISFYFCNVARSNINVCLLSATSVIFCPLGIQYPTNTQRFSFSTFVLWQQKRLALHSCGLFLRWRHHFGHVITNMAPCWLGESALIAQKLPLVAISREKNVSCNIACNVAACVRSFILYWVKTNFIESADQLTRVSPLENAQLASQCIYSHCTRQRIYYFICEHQ